MGREPAVSAAGLCASRIPSAYLAGRRPEKLGQDPEGGRGEVPVFLHTQPWSYEAVGLYLKAGFFLCRSETFGTHKNQFQEGIRILEQYLEVDPRLCR